MMYVGEALPRDNYSHSIHVALFRDNDFIHAICFGPLDLWCFILISMVAFEKRGWLEGSE
jgi:hypothetical protein